MSWRRAAAAIAIGSAIAGCSPFGGGAFQCTDSPQCGAGGVCEANGLCSFADAGCASGRSYGEASGELSGVCVGDEPPDAAVADGPVGADAPRFDAAVDGPPPPPFCDPSDATLRLCLPFEGDAVDGSGNALTVSTTSIAFAAGQVGQGVVVDGASRLDIAETAAMDFGHMTIEAWINVTLPGAGRAGIVDNNGQYGFFFYANGDLRCTPAGGVTVPAVIASGTWTHVACTYDGATEVVYVNGTPAGMIVSAGSISSGGGQGTSIAGDNPPGPERMVGTMDQLRVYSEARTPVQICQAAGTCP